MAGDEIVADWLGDVYGNNITTTDAPQRLDSNSRRFKTVTLQNFHASYTIWLGKYYSNTATFIGSAIYLSSLEILKLQFVDLHELGCSTYTTGYDSSIRILGINEY